MIKGPLFLASLFHPRETLATMAKDDAGIPWSLWAWLVLIAVMGSCLYGGSLALLFPHWHWLQGALWITLSAGLSWCLFIPALVILNNSRFTWIVQACLVTMAYGEAILSTGAMINGAAYRGLLQIPSVGFNEGTIFLSNVVMVSVLAYQLSGLGISKTKTVFLWMVVLNGSGGLFFWIFKRLLFGGVS